MKKVFLFLLVAVILVFSSAAFISCGEDSEGGTVQCTAHTDANGDGSCDSCGAKIGGGNAPEAEYTREGDYICFGEYPQSEVTDEVLKASLTAKAGALPTSADSGTWTSYGYYISGTVQDFMWYQDITSGGERYRGVYFTSYRPYYIDYSNSLDYTYQDDNGYNTSSVYWFKYEPIKWRILDEKDGKAFLLCEMLIDSQECYHDCDEIRIIDGKEIYANNYEYSNIRAWLNDEFYNTAFTSLQQQIILTTNVDNGVESTGYASNEYACKNTNDKIFLPSMEEIMNADYGFSTEQLTADTERQKQFTNYAQSQGARVDSSNTSGDGAWWLRSPWNDDSNAAWAVYFDGAVCYSNGHAFGADVDRTMLGICPAFWISLG